MFHELFEDLTAVDLVLPAAAMAVVKVIQDGAPQLQGDAP